MDKIFKVGVRVKGQPGTVYEDKTGVISRPVWYFDGKGTPIPVPKDSPEWGVLWEGKRPVKMREKDLEIIE